MIRQKLSQREKTMTYLKSLIRSANKRRFKKRQWKVRPKQFQMNLNRYIRESELGRTIVVISRRHPEGVILVPVVGVFRHKTLVGKTSKRFIKASRR
jgi:hypothetical protein